jgi:hypothetical protein
MSVERVRRFQVRGAQSYRQNGEFRLDFNDIQPLALGHTYVRAVELAVDVTWANASAGAVNVPAAVGHNVIKTLKAAVPGGHVFFDLGSQAGEALFKGQWIASGKLPESPGTVAVGAAGTATARYKIRIPIGYLDGALEGDDYNVPLRELQRAGVAIEGTWANGETGGDFDIGGGAVTLNVATAIRSAVVELIARPEVRVGPYLTWKLQRLAGAEERPTAGNMIVHNFVELPTPAYDAAAASRLTETFLSAAARTEVEELSFDGVNVRESVAVADLITIFNRKAQTADDRITQHEANTTRAIPIYTPAESLAKITHKPSSREHPMLKLGGTATTPRLLMIMSRMVDDRATMESSNALGVQAAGGGVAKTASKTELDRKSGAGAYFRMPRKLG